MEEELISLSVTEEERDELSSGLYRLIEEEMPGTDQWYFLLELKDKLYR